MQVKCPHCRYKYNEVLKPGMTELVSICPRCGQSYSVEVTDEDILKEQTPPPTPAPNIQQPAAVNQQPPAVPVVTPAIPEVTPVPAAAQMTPARPSVPSVSSANSVLSKQSGERTLPRYNYSPAPSSNRLKVMVLFIVAAVFVAGAIFLLSTLFGRDETQPVETIASSTSTSGMSSSEMGNFAYSFEGNIKGKKKDLPIKMKITKTGTIVEGSYYYVNQTPTVTLELKGKVADDGIITMREYVDGEENSGSFEGSIDANGKFNGTFRYLKNKYKFELKRVKSKQE